MALGGGVFTTQNKVLPGAYINTVSSIANIDNLFERGVVAIGLEMDWGSEDVFNIEVENFASVAQSKFGYKYNDDKLKGIRDIFKNAIEVYFYRLINGGNKASNAFGEAKYKGVRGNKITNIIAVNADDNSKFDVDTLLDGDLVDSQTVAAAANLIDNDYVVFDKEATLSANAGAPMSGGSNGDAITGTQYSAFLSAIEPYTFNTLACLSTDDTIKDLYISFTKRLRDEKGIKFQCVVYKRESADYEGVVSVDNACTTVGALASALVFWACGALAGTEINESATNKLYDGEFDVDINYTTDQCEQAIADGKFLFYLSGKEVRVLVDINTLTTVTEEKGNEFSKNQTIRVVDQVANDIAYLFNSEYLGAKANDASNRVALWSDIVAHHRNMEAAGAIENFNAGDIEVVAGESKNGVVVTDYITPTSAMEQLYMTVVVQ